MQSSKKGDKSSLDAEIVAEAHHRVKNTLQNIVSYVNVMFATRDQVSREELMKLTRYVHALSLIHDVLLREVHTSGSGKHVRIDRIIQDLVELYAVEMDLVVQEIPPCITTTRRAATVSLILNELIDNGKRYGKGRTSVNCCLLDSTTLEISVSNPLPQGREANAEILFGNGLRISSLLAQRDLESNLVVSPDAEMLTIRFTAPVEPITAAS